MTTPTNKLQFPHPELTSIVGKPDNPSIQKLKKEIYANAVSIYSELGGGDHGHLALLLTLDAYHTLTRKTYNVPEHPGALAVHARTADAATITENNRQHAALLASHTLHRLVSNALKKQLIQAVEHRYLALLEDPEFGFSDVSCRAILIHLIETYGKITIDDVTNNRDSLLAPWNPDDPIEDLWLRIHEARRYAKAADEEISEKTAISHTLTALEKNGVFTQALYDWRKRPDTQWTLTLFKEDFTRADKERLRALTATTAGYHGANAVNPTVSEIPANVTNAAIPVIPTTSPSRGIIPNPPAILPSGYNMYYCWSHGLGTNPDHTSQTCRNKKTGHVDTATADKMKGGNNTIMTERGWAASYAQAATYHQNT